MGGERQLARVFAVCVSVWLWIASAAAAAAQGAAGQAR